MTRSLFLSFLLVSTLTSYGQKCDKEIRGRILDLQSNDPVPLATIQIEGTENGTTSDEDGYFLFKNICPGEVHLLVKHIAFKSIEHHHDTYHQPPVIYLAPLSISLEGLVVEDQLDHSQSKTVAGKSLELSNVETLGASAGELASRLSGVSTISTGANVVKPMIHGLHSNRVLLINNEVRHLNQNWGQDHAPEIDVSNLGQLKVIKGAGTVRYGPDALGGVLLFNPVKPKYDSKLGGSIHSGFSTNGRAFNEMITLSQGSHRFAWQASANYQKQGDLRAQDYFLTNTGREDLGFQFTGILHRPKYDLEIFGSHLNQKIGILRGSVTGNLEDLARAMTTEPPPETSPFSYTIDTPNQETTHDLIKLKSSIFLGEHEIHAQYAFQRNLRQEFDVRRGQNNGVPSIDLELYSHSVDMDWTYPSEVIDGTIGFQMFVQDNNNLPGTNTLPFVPNYNILNLGVFTMQSRELNSGTIEVGLRFDMQSMSARGRERSGEVFLNDWNYQNFTGLIGYTHIFSQNVALRNQIATAWRPPNVAELYSYGRHLYNYSYGLLRYEIDENGAISTNNVLDPSAKSVGTEKGIKWVSALEFNAEKVQFELVGYANLISNYFFQRPYGVTNTPRGPYPYFIWDQSEAMFLGADFDLRKIHSNLLESELNGSFVYAQETESNQYFIDIPPINLNYKLTWKNHGWRVSFQTEYTARQFLTPKVISPLRIVDGTQQINEGDFFDFKEAPRGYLLFHASSGMEAGKWYVDVRMRNLLNTDYRVYTDRLRYFADNPGYNLSLNIIYKI